MNAQPTADLLTLAEASELLRISPSTLRRRLLAEGLLCRALPVGRVLFRRADIMKLLAEGAGPPTLPHGGITA